MVSSMLDFATSMKPSNFQRVLVDTIHYYGWRNLIYLYCSPQGRSVGGCGDLTPVFDKQNEITHYSLQHK
jgi:hypothetical protein